MKRYLLLFVLLLVCLMTSAKHVERVNKVAYPGGKCYIFRVMLSDKSGSAYRLDAPEKFLSQRAIDRRIKQNLKIDSTDLPISTTYLETLRQGGFEIVGKSKWNNSVIVRSRRHDVSSKLSRLPFVKKVILAFSSPDSIETSSRVNFHKELSDWNFSPTSEYGATEEQILALNGIRLHNAGYQGAGKLIAVFDGGFMNVDKIPAMQKVQYVGTADFVVPRSNNLYKEMDHGTMVLSTMAGNSPNIYIGTAPKASYLLVRCEDKHSESLVEEDYWAEAAELADSMGVDIINSSLGYHNFDDKTTSHKYSDMDGETTLISHTASMLAGKGIILVNSAGNDGMGTWKKINFPADARDILTVGAVNSDGVNAPFSSVGPTADGRVKPDVMAFGSPAAVITGRGTIINDMGTSFAAPLVCGMTACLWEALPDMTAFEIIELVKSTAKHASCPDNIYGFGVPDFWKAYTKGKDKNKR